MPGTALSGPAPRPSRPVRRARRLVSVAAALVAGLALAPAAPAAPASAVAVTDESVQTTPATYFRVGSFNVLGADHTAPGGKRKGWDPGVVRMDRVVQLLGEQTLDVVGFQEFQPPQATRFNELMGTSWQTYPGLDTTAGPSVNSIAWRTDRWTLLESRTLPIPYFSGVPSRMPAVLLQNQETGRRVWFFNTHNPADVRGPAQQWRDAGFAMEVALANELRAAYPDAPFISLGDKNERAHYYCSVAPAADMWSASGGYTDGTTCSAPAGGAIDWIMGTKDVYFNGYTRHWNDFVSRTSDHPLYYANAVVPASSPPAVDHVVVVAVPGLTSAVAADLNGAGEIARMNAAGAHTGNARTATETTSPDAGLMSLLTARRVFPKRGGHGVGSKPTLPSTVQGSAGQYVSSIFDLAHNTSHNTTFVSSRKETELVRRSWNKKSGGKDPYGKDDGTAKLDKFKVAKDDATVVSWWKDRVGRRASDLSVIELSGVLRAGDADGYTGAKYQRAVKKTFRRVATIRRAISQQAEMNGTTLLVVVGTAGAQRDKKAKTWAESFRVPMWVTGPGVAAGSDLYALNPSYSEPTRTTQVGYSGTQPIRVGDVASLVTRSLGLPPIPGATMDVDQRFSAFDPVGVPGS